MKIYRKLRNSESPFTELKSLPKLTIHREDIGLDWQKRECKSPIMLCDSGTRWTPMKISDSAEKQCSFYSSRVRFDGKFRNITMIKNCLGLMTNLETNFLDDGMMDL